MLTSNYAVELSTEFKKQCSNFSGTEIALIFDQLSKPKSTSKLVHKHHDLRTRNLLLKTEDVRNRTTVSVIFQLFEQEKRVLVITAKKSTATGRPRGWPLYRHKMLNWVFSLSKESFAEAFGSL